MTTTILVHLERDPDADQMQLLWWAEIEDVPGYYASAESVTELRALVTEGLDDAAEEYGFDAKDVQWRLITDPEPDELLDKPTVEWAERTFGSPPTEGVHQVASKTVRHLAGV